MKNHKVLILITILIMSFGALQAFDKDKPASDEKRNQYESLPKGVSIHQLDNGMEVLLIEKPSLPMIGVNVVVKVGSAYESFASSGMSHMLEHLLFNGTTTMSQKELYDAVDRIGGYNNANTSTYYTNYMMVTPSENFKQGMQIQSDMLFRSTLPEKKFQKEKGIVMEEIAKSLGKPAEQIERNITGILYPDHALSLPTLGTYETIKNMEREDVHSFYKNYYVPNNMRMSVVGNFKSAEMLELVNEIYGNAKPGNIRQSSSIEWSTGFNYNSEKSPVNTMYHRFYKGKNHQLQFFYAMPTDMSDEFVELFDIQLRKMNDQLKSELDVNTPESVKSVSLGSRNTPVVSYLQITLNLLNTDNMDAVIETTNNWIINQSFQMAANEVEIEVIKARTKFSKNTEKPHMFGIFNAGAIAENGFQPIIDSFHGLGYYTAAAKLKNLKFAERSAIILQYPDATEETEKSGSEAITEFVEQKPGSPSIITRQIEQSDILAIHYLLKHKAFYENKYGKNAAKVWHAAFGERMKKVLKKDKNYRYGFTFAVNDNPWIPMDNIYLHPDFGYIRAEGLADDIAGSIGFINAQMSDFVPTREEFTKAQSGLKRSAMMSGKNKAEAVFKTSWQNEVYAPAKYPHNKTELTYESLLEFGKSYFQPENMIISIVSPAGKEEISSLFADFNGSVNVKSDDASALNRGFKLNNKPVEISKEEKGEQTYLFYGYMKQIQESEIAAVKALNLLLRDHIVFDIREKRGMAYRMSAGIDIKEDIALFYIRLGTRPENEEKLVPLFPSFFTDDFEEKITREELTKAVNMYLGRMMFRRLSSINQGYYLGESYYFTGDYNIDAEKLQALKNVTLEQVQNVAEKYLNVENAIQIIVK